MDDEAMKSAIKAKTMAEKKMEKNNFSSALRFALKAQQLYPDLENISHIILVCDVLCSAKKKVNSKEYDWYAILKVKATADKATIRNQYLKFVLDLHPDKNSVIGASDAFSLISQARNVLTDSNLRSIYDKKLRLQRSNVSRVNYQAPKQAHYRRHSPYQKKSCSNKSTSKCTKLLQQLQNNPFVDDKSTFWTKCPLYLSVFLHYKKIIGKKVDCQNCKMKFPALENRYFYTVVTGLIKQSSMQQEETSINHPKEVSECAPHKSSSNIELEKNIEEIHVEDRNTASNLKSDMEADTTTSSPKPLKTYARRKKIKLG